MEGERLEMSQEGNRLTTKSTELLCCPHLVPGASETVCLLCWEVTRRAPGLPKEAPSAKMYTLDPGNAPFPFGATFPVIHALSFFPSFLPRKWFTTVIKTVQSQ